MFIVDRLCFVAPIFYKTIVSQSSVIETSSENLSVACDEWVLFVLFLTIIMIAEEIRISRSHRVVLREHFIFIFFWLFNLFGERVFELARSTTDRQGYRFYSRLLHVLLDLISRHLTLGFVIFLFFNFLICYLLIIQMFWFLDRRRVFILFIIYFFLCFCIYGMYHYLED